MKIFLSLFLFVMIQSVSVEAQDWPNLGRYKDDNAQVLVDCS